STRPSMVRRTLCDGARETACCAAAQNGKADVQAMKRRLQARWEFTIVLNEQILVTEKSGTAREERQWRRSRPKSHVISDRSLQPRMETVRQSRNPTPIRVNPFLRGFDAQPLEALPSPVSIFLFWRSETT